MPVESGLTRQQNQTQECKIAQQCRIFADAQRDSLRERVRATH